MEKQYDFNEVEVLSAVAVGAPGKRTFFVAVGRKEEWVRIWLEKQELQALALAIRQLLFSLSQDEPLSPEEPEDVPTVVLSSLPSAELEPEEISLGYEEGRAVLSISVRALGPQRADGKTVSCRPTLNQLRQFCRQAESICAAGRPICPLCGGPIDPSGHNCPSRN